MKIDFSLCCYLMSAEKIFIGKKLILRKQISDPPTKKKKKTSLNLGDIFLEVNLERSQSRTGSVAKFEHWVSSF